jgi:hypothetical protein
MEGDLGWGNCRLPVHDGRGLCHRNWRSHTRFAPGMAIVAIWFHTETPRNYLLRRVRLEDAHCVEALPGVRNKKLEKLSQDTLPTLPQSALKVLL